VIRQFSFYGVGVKVESAVEEFLESVEHDFSYFLAPDAPVNLELTYEQSPPDYDQLPELTCSLATPRNICFSNGRLT
jgi:hypothetical protein